MAQDVLERKRYHAGSVLISAANQENYNAYWIKEGEVMGYIQDEQGNMIEVSRHGPGDIIGEGNLVKNISQEINYRAVTDSTIVTITRHSFQKNLKKLEQTTQSIFYTLVEKITNLEKEKQTYKLQNAKIENEAYSIVSHLLRNMPHDRQKRYEEILLPQFNVMVKAIDEIKRQERYERQQRALDERLEQLKGKDNDPDNFIDLERKAYEGNQTIQ